MEENKDKKPQEKAEIFSKEIWIKKNERGEPVGYKFELNIRNGLLFYLHLILMNKENKLTQEDKEELLGVLNYLQTHLADLEITPKRGKQVRYRYRITGQEGEDQEEVRKQIEHYITSNKFVLAVLGDLIKQIREARKQQKKRKPKGKIRTGGHLVDNILKGGKPSSTQLELWDNLLQETRDKILDEGATIEAINRKGEGIKLSKGEYKLLHCLSEILHEKSQIDDKKEDSYYSGNIGYEVIKWETKDGAVEVKMPKVSFTLYEIAKKYQGDEEIGGSAVKEVARILTQLADDPDKKCLLRYTRTVALDKNRTREYFIERYSPLIEITNIGWRDMLNDKQINEKKELVVHLHPIFRDQIESKNVTIPGTRELIEAYGGSNISEITTKLVYELARAHSNKRRLPKDEEGNPVYQIGEEKLFYRIAEDYMPPNRRRIPLIKKYLDKSIETVKKMDLILGYEIRAGATGENIYHFTLSKKW